MLLLMLLIIFFNNFLRGSALLWPAASSISVVASVSTPVFEYFPDRKIILDWCFSMAHDLPSKVSSFYNIPIWPGKHSPPPITKRAIQGHESGLHNETNLLEAYKKYNYKAGKNRHIKDFSAGELYQGIEDLLVSYGYHETCLLRSVCELAQHPFDDNAQNILTDVITFLLTPSVHEGFDANEQLYRETYTNAEIRGFLGEDCAHLYAGCKQDLLAVITKVIFIHIMTL